jgi:pimeloyl-ACP methyl ester carboxylesterase
VDRLEKEISAPNRDADSIERRASWIWLRVTAMMLAGLGVLLVGVAAMFYFSQHSLIYHPRPYWSGYEDALPEKPIEVEYTVPFGKQTAYYIPAKGGAPKRLWVVFCGNASLALDWATIFTGYPEKSTGFLLVDYPGYGRNAGYATIDSTRATANAAFDALAKRLGINKDGVELCLLGHSLGAAACLDFGAQYSIQRAVLISPFTTLREEAAYVVGGLLSRVLVENYDNRKNLGEIVRRNSNVRIAIFHGTQDTDIPVRMGADLKRNFPTADFFPIQNADHATVLYVAKDQLIAWMTR